MTLEPTLHMFTRGLAMSKYAIVWIDHREARIFQVSPHTSVEATVHAPVARVYEHPKGAEEPKEHPDDAKHFFQGVSAELKGCERILVVGPSSAKLEFVRHARQHDALFERHLVDVKTVDHPSDRQIVAYARKYFKASEIGDSPAAEHSGIAASQSGSSPSN